jgi:hypothetical protein
VALYSIDAVVDGHDYLPADAIDRFEAFRGGQLGAKKAPFANVSDLLVAMFPTPDQAQLTAAAKILDQVTVSSSAFDVVAENRVTETARSDPKRRPTISRINWMLALDREPFSLLSWTVQPGS